MMTRRILCWFCLVALGGLLNLSGQVDVRFQGNEALSAEELREGLGITMETLREYGLDEANAFDAAYFAEAYYRKQGFPEATVEFQIAGPTELVLQIREGPRIEIGEIDYQAAEAFPQETLNEYLLGPLRERFPRTPVPELPFVESDLEAGALTLQRFFVTEGYPNAEVGPLLFDEEGTSVNVSVPIKSGTQYRFGDVQFLGGEAIADDRLQETIAEALKEPYSENRMEAIARRIQDVFVTEGYYNAEVTPTASFDQQLANLEVRITPGPRYRFGGVVVEESTRLPDSFYKNRLRSLQGQFYNPEDLAKIYRELIQTGLFRNLRIDPRPGPDGEIQLHVRAEQAKSKEFGIGLGFSTFYGAIVSGTYRDLSLFNTGRPLTLELEWNQRGLNGEIRYEDPWFLESEFELMTRLFADQEELKGYSKTEFGFQLGFSRNIEPIEIEWLSTLRNVRITDILIEPESLVGKKEYTIFSQAINLVWDRRNDRFIPTRGTITTLSFEGAPPLSDGVGYVRLLGRFSWYLPVTRRSTLSFGARAGVVVPAGGEELPIEERFFNGGATTVRSFSELTLGPKDDQGYPIGGEGFTVFNAEYTFPIIGDLYGALFADAGNLVSEARDFGLEEMRYAIGAGLRYNLPIGAVRLDYGWNPAPARGEATGAFHFAIGVAF